MRQMTNVESAEVMTKGHTTSPSNNTTTTKDSKILPISKIVGTGKEETRIILPQEFQVKYLGKRNSSGLWGIKHTRGPVDELVEEAKKATEGKSLSQLKLKVSESGVFVSGVAHNANHNFTAGLYPIDIISYGVQDLVYTRVFAMIIVNEMAKSDPSAHPFHCHAFVCDTRNSARNLTFALAEAFQIFSKKVQSSKVPQPKKFAIDLRSAEEIEAEFKDSEA